MASSASFVGGLLRQRLAGVVVFRRHLQLLDEVERLLVHGLMVAHHVLRERLDVLVAGLFDRLLGGGDVDDAGRVGDMRDLGIGGLCALRQRGAPVSRLSAAIAALNRTNMV